MIVSGAPPCASASFTASCSVISAARPLLVTRLMTSGCAAVWKSHIVLPPSGRALARFRREWVSRRLHGRDLRFQQAIPRDSVEPPGDDAQTEPLVETQGAGVIVRGDQPELPAALLPPIRHGVGHESAPDAAARTRALQRHDF